MPSTVGLILTMILATPGTASSELTEPLAGETEAGAGPIHPDCLDHRQPRICTRVVEELIEELGRFNEAFNPPDADQLAAFYHEDAILFVGSTGRFFRGHDEIRDGPARR
jgi:hypothetical protein